MLGALSRGCGDEKNTWSKGTELFRGMLGSRDNGIMSVPEILKTIADGFQSSATVKNVYGEPISKGDTTVIPVARLSYAFGGGGGREAEGSTEKDGGRG